MANDTRPSQTWNERKLKKALALYDPTTLQRDANRACLGTRRSRRWIICKASTKKKLCTYPRTDSRYLTDDMESGVNALALCCAGMRHGAAYCHLFGTGLQQQKGQRPHAVVPIDGGGRNGFGNLARRRTGSCALFPSGAYGGRGAPFVYLETEARLDCGGNALSRQRKTILNMG